MGEADFPDRITIGVLSRLTDCGVETIRYYERVGLLAAPPRSDGGHRLYAPGQVRRLRFIRHGRELGLGLAQIRELLDLVDGDDYTCGEVLALAEAHLAAVRQRITELRDLERTLSGVIDRCQGGGVADCPIVEVLFDQSAG